MVDGERANDLGRRVGRAVVDDDDLVGLGDGGERGRRLLEERPDVLRLVVGGEDATEQPDDRRTSCFVRVLYGMDEA
jgi:hypothetical protein